MPRRSLALVVLAVAGNAAAAGGESSLAVSPGFCTFTVGQAEDVNGYGGMVSVDYLHGVSDALSFRVAAGGGLFSAGGELSYGATATVGVYYAVDVLRYVPYVTAAVGGFVAGGGAVDTRVRAILEVGAGLEVLEGRSWSWGIELRLASFASQATVVTVGPRISWKWGYF